MLHYTLSLDNPASHLATVSIDIETAGAAEVEIEFPAWSPGRYFIYDFSRNVQDLRAVDGNGKGLDARKVTKGRWRIACAGVERVVVSYRMYAATLSGTFSMLDDRHASINGSSMFAWVVGRQTEEIALEIVAPDGWKVYTSMPRRRRGGRNQWQALNYDVLIDSPIEIGRPIARLFRHDGIAYHIILDIAGAAGTARSRKVRAQIERFVKEVEKVVITQTSTFGRPEFDEYFFLVNIDPFANSGDGMEHLSSTRLVLNGYITDEDSYNDLIGVASHEFFHIWNVKRMRPAELGPFNYSAEHHTTLLWLAEGFTQYYGHLMLRRAGVWDDKQFHKELVSEINTVDRSPGRFHRNLRESSFDTWHSVGRRSLAGTTSNYRNTYVNYYPKGAVVALMLDMEIRRLTNDRRSLDDLVRELYKTTYANTSIEGYYLRGSGYSEEDVLAVCERVAGRAARRYLARLIESRSDIDYNKGLAHVGLRVVRGGGKNNGNGEKKPLFMGISTADTNGNGEFVGIDNILPGSPAEKGGLSPNDIIIALDGERVTMKRWEKVMAMKRAGEEIEIAFFRGIRLMTTTIRGLEHDHRHYRIESIEKPTAAQKRARRKWEER